MVDKLLLSFKYFFKLLFYNNFIGTADAKEMFLPSDRF